MFYLICAWTNGWVNNQNAGTLRCHHAHYNVTVINCFGGTWTSYSISVYSMGFSLSTSLHLASWQHRIFIGLRWAKRLQSILTTILQSSWYKFETHIKLDTIVFINKDNYDQYVEWISNHKTNETTEMVKWIVFFIRNLHISYKVLKMFLSTHGLILWST